MHSEVKMWGQNVTMVPIGTTQGLRKRTDNDLQATNTPQRSTA